MGWRRGCSGHAHRRGGVSGCRRMGKPKMVRANCCRDVNVDLPRFCRSVSVLELKRPRRTLAGLGYRDWWPMGGAGSLVPRAR